jgi:hypothetical protein
MVCFKSVPGFYQALSKNHYESKDQFHALTTVRLTHLPLVFYRL